MACSLPTALGSISHYLLNRLEKTPKRGPLRERKPIEATFTDYALKFDEKVRKKLNASQRKARAGEAIP